LALRNLLFKADAGYADAGPWTRVTFEDVDPMPDYENVLTD